MKSMQFEIIDKKGNKIICEVIATYHDDDTNKDFIVYTDKTLDENKKLKVYYSLYKKIDNSIKLIDITSNDDKKIGLQLVKEIIDSINN